MVPYLTVYETIYYSLLMEVREQRHKEVRNINDIVKNIILQFNLSHIQNSMIGDNSSNLGLSPGERRRVYIAQAIVGQPSFMFIDDPTADLDTFHSYKIIELLRQMTCQGRSIIITTNHSRYGFVIMHVFLNMHTR
jgi:ABC-type multidrug transport system ATPase subunit